VTEPLYSEAELKATAAKDAARQAYWEGRGARRTKKTRAVSISMCAACKSTKGPFEYQTHVVAGKATRVLIHVGCPGPKTFVRPGSK
jgi:hypothetical protein